MDLDGLSVAGGHEEKQVVEVPGLTVGSRSGTLSVHQSLQQSAQRRDRQPRPSKLGKDDTPRLIGSERPKPPQRVEVRHPFFWDTEFGWCVLVRDVFEFDAIERPVEFVLKEAKEVFKRPHITQPGGVDVNHQPANSIQQISFGSGASSGASSCLR